MLRYAALLAGAWTWPAIAQVAPAVVISPAPDRVSVTVYRDPGADGDAGIDLRYLRGFALVTETRTVRLPKGAAVVRFEGVAEGIVPVSAIIAGLPGGTVEKNRDAALLSPAALVDGTLGRVVTLTRTDRATGRQSSEQATIVAGPEPGIVLKTEAGIETLRCSGLPEMLRFRAIPAGLSAKPVLSVTTDTANARTVTVTLSYLASGFDWRASYVATVAADGRTLDLFAWLTLANGNPERFADAEVQAVAGRLNRTAPAGFMRRIGALRLKCFPLGTTTSDLRQRTFQKAEPIGYAEGAGDIVVTAARAMAPAPSAPPAPPPPPEDLGDLKLYRVPGRVTVSPRGQKQVALLAADGVPFARRYRVRLFPGLPAVAQATDIALVVENRTADRLGIALPAGTTALYARRSGAGVGAAVGVDRLLLGTGRIADRAAGETVRIGAGVSRQVLVTHRTVERDHGAVTVTNANAVDVTVEVAIGAAGQKVTAEGGAALDRIDGVATWVVTVPAHGSREMGYRY